MKFGDLLIGAEFMMPVLDGVIRVNNPILKKISDTIYTPSEYPQYEWTMESDREVIPYPWWDFVTLEINIDDLTRPYESTA